jgi:hypothetical protein
MTDIEAKALALANEVSDGTAAADRIEQLEREKAVVSDLWEQQKQIALDYLADCNKAADHIEAQCRAIEQHEAFKQEVSKAMTYIKALYPTLPTDYDRFIIPAPKPDPLVEVIKEWWNMDIRENDAETLRELLEARGLEIREKEQNK